MENILERRKNILHCHYSYYNNRPVLNRNKKIFFRKYNLGRSEQAVGSLPVVAIGLTSGVNRFIVGENSISNKSGFINLLPRDHKKCIKYEKDILKKLSLVPL